jgi:hypothetical protein
MPAVRLVAGVANFGKRMSNARLFQPMHAFPESLFDDFSFKRSEIFVLARQRPFECDLDNMRQAPIVLGQCGLPDPLLSATCGQHIGADKAAAKNCSPPPCGYRGQLLTPAATTTGRHSRVGPHQRQRRPVTARRHLRRKSERPNASRPPGQSSKGHCHTGKNRRFSRGFATIASSLNR